MLNPSFSVAGAQEQLADGWSVRARSLGSVPLVFGELHTLTPIADPNDAAGGSWTPTGLTVATNTGDDPDGVATADTLTDTAVNAAHLLQGVPQALASGARATFAVHVQDISRGFAVVAWGAGSADFGYALVDLTTGSTTATARGGLVGKVSSVVTALADAWFLVELSILTTGAIGAIRPSVGPATASSFTYLGTLQSIRVWGASVSAAPFESVDGFERSWLSGDYLTTLTIPTSASPALFATSFVSPNPYEDFETAWGGYPFLFTMAGGVSASFAGSSFDGIESGWGVGAFATTIVGGVTATFDGEFVEDFEEGWLDTAYATTIVGGVVATFDGPNAEAFEDFEEAARDTVVSADPTANALLAPGHTLTTTTPGYVVSAVSIHPGGLYANVLYWPVNIASGSFQVSLTQGGAAVDIEDTGAGALVFRLDPSRSWNTLGLNPTI